jgi:hypothetical protein
MNKKTQAKKSKVTKKVPNANPVLHIDHSLLIDNIFRLAKGSSINRVAELYRIIMKAPETIRPELIKEVSEKYGNIESSEKRPVPEIISEAEKTALKARYGGTVNAMLDALIKSNLPQDAFYSGIYSLIQNPFYKTDQARIFSLYYILIDKRIPYFQLPEGLRMSDEEYKNRLQRNETIVKRLKFILSCQFQQRTEEADLVLKAIDQAKNEDRVVILAQLLSDLRRETEELKAAILQAR